MEQNQIRVCWGCKAKFTANEELAHYQSAGIARYGVASPECSAAYFDILARESELYGYPPAHRLIVDAYSVQHPRVKEIQEKLNVAPRLVDASVQSVACHLIALYCAIEKGMELHAIAGVMDTFLTNMNKQGAEFDELAPPANLGAIKVDDVKKTFFEKDLSLEQYTDLAWRWARTAWDAWEDHHATISAWFEKYYS